MQRIVVTGKVADLKKWEEGFRTHTDLFKAQTIVSPIELSTPEGGNDIAVIYRVNDLQRFHEVMASPATAEAMQQDGFDRDSVKIFPVDKEINF